MTVHDKNFAGDSVYFLQRHFVDCMISGREFESNGEDYLKTLRAVEAAYESAQRTVANEGRIDESSKASKAEATVAWMYSR